MADLVAAELGIQQLHARYIDAVWREDIETFGDCFTPDCEWRIFGQLFAGRDAVQEMMRGVVKRVTKILITMRPPVIGVIDGALCGRSYFTEQSKLTTGQPLLVLGTNYVRYADDRGRWRFDWRLFDIDYMGPPDFSGQYFDNPDYGPAPAMPPRDAIPVDHRRSVRM